MNVPNTVPRLAPVLSLIMGRVRPYYRRLRDRARTARYSWYDYRRYLKLSGALKHAREIEAVEAARITKFYHMIEKGLSLPETRASFGHYAITELSAMLNSAIRAGRNGPHIRHAIETLIAYRDFNARVGGETPLAATSVLALAAAADFAAEPDAVREMTRAEIASATDFDVNRFFSTRASVRQFANRSVPREKIEAAVRIAQTAPTVCNRQSGRVRIVTDPARRSALLKFQNGNRGFGDTIGALAIVTVDLSHFLEPAERHQAWIDGGLFAMQFIMGLHAQQLGSCCLNWATASNNDARFRAASQLPDSETVITFIAIGELRERFVVARSPRKSLTDVLRYDEVSSS